MSTVKLLLLFLWCVGQRKLTTLLFFQENTGTHLSQFHTWVTALFHVFFIPDCQPFCPGVFQSSNHCERLERFPEPLPCHWERADSLCTGNGQPTGHAMWERRASVLWPSLSLEKITLPSKARHLSFHPHLISDQLPANNLHLPVRTFD